MARSKLKMAPKAKQGIAPKGKAGALRRPELARECQFLITNSDKPGQHLGYSIFFDGEKFTGKDAPGYEGAAEKTLSETMYFEGKPVSREDNPELWFTALPVNFDGMMVRAMMIEGDATEKVAQDAFEPYGITKYCVYTIVDGERLVRLAKEIGKHSFIQSKPWVTARNLWQKTSLAKESMPILFGDATNCSRLLFWGLLTNVCVEGRETTFVVDRLRELSEEHEPQELVLRSSGKYIAPNFIRPYAICLTPHFLNFAQTG